MSARRARRASALLLACAAVLTSACETPTIPGREEAYPFSYVAGDLVFHWPAGSTVHVYVDESGDPARAALLTSAAAHAIAAWNDAVLFGEYRLVRAAALGEADVLLRWSDTELPVRTPDPARCAFHVGRAVTTFCPQFDDATGSSGRLLVFPRVDVEEDGQQGRVRFVVTMSTVEADGGRLKALVTHEVGHTLGILRHPGTNVGSSVMLELPTDSVPTPADRATIQVLYHTRADLRL